MEKALILKKEDLEKFSEIRHAIVTMGAALALYRRGSLTMEVAFGRIAAEIRRADDAMTAFYIGGL